jgi:hypothetical protein
MLVILRLGDNHHEHGALDIETPSSTHAGSNLFQARCVDLANNTKEEALTTGGGVSSRSDAVRLSTEYLCTELLLFGSIPVHGREVGQTGLQDPGNQRKSGCLACSASEALGCAPRGTQEQASASQMVVLPVMSC